MVGIYLAVLNCNGGSGLETKAVCLITQREVDCRDCQQLNTAPEEIPMLKGHVVGGEFTTETQKEQGKKSRLRLTEI